MRSAGGLTQTERLIRYLRANPGASGMELVTALRMPKYTSRISDARDQGIDIVCFKDAEGVSRYRVVDHPRQMVFNLGMGSGSGEF